MYSKVLEYRNRGFDVSIGDENTILRIIRGLDSGAFESLQSVSNANASNLKNSLLKTIDGFDNPVLIAKKLYDELNRRVNYSVKWMQVDNNINFLEDKKAIYNQNVSLSTIKEGDNVICKGWSQLYKEILVAAGFDERQITIEGGNNLGSHKWISIDLGDGNVILADATNAITGTTDLLNAKLGESSKEFLIFNPSKSGLKKLSKSPINYYDTTNHPELNDFLNNTIKSNLDNIDSAIENITGTVPEKVLEQAASSFRNPSLVSKIFGGNTVDAANSVLWNIDLPENLKGIEAFVYLKKLARTLIPDDNLRNNNFQFNIYVDDIGDSINVISMNSNGSPVYEIFSNKLGKVIVNSLSELNNYLIGYNKLIW